MTVATNWFVITGAPCSGKSQLIDVLAYDGFSIRPEAARILINEEMSTGCSIDEIRADAASFQSRVLEMKVAAERRADPNELIFWERGIPDSIVYFAHYGIDIVAAQRASLQRRYGGVFLLDRLPRYEVDYARTESDAHAARIHEDLARAYADMGYSIIRVPVTSLAERARIILAHART